MNNQHVDDDPGKNVSGLPKIIIVCGPTGIGKTSTAIRLCLECNGEIIGADSMQLYRYMNIGTAKPAPHETEKVPHHMIDVADPDDAFDAGTFAEMASEHIRRLIHRKKIPFVVGGTGLYIKALVHGLSRARPADAQVISRLKAEAEKIGGKALHDRLAKLDPQAAGKIHPNDTFRVIRALEIYIKTGKPISHYHNKHRFIDRKFDTLKIGLELPRETLYQRINTRVDIMIQEGLLSEVRGLFEKGYAKDLKSMQSLGYRHMTAFLNQEISWEEAVDTLKRDTRHYAKRQMTWFKADAEINWFRPEQINVMQGAIASFLSGT